MYLSCTARLLAFILSCVMLSLPAAMPAQAQERTIDAARTAERETRRIEARQQLEDIHKALVELRARVEQLRQGLDTAEDNEQREIIQQQIDQLETQRRNLRNTFENIALGGIDLGVFTDQPEQDDFNWQDELLSIMRPLFSEMRQLTERPRAIERLRRDRMLVGQRLHVVEQALANIDAIATTGFDAVALERLEQLRQSWLERRTDLVRQQGIIELQLDNLLERQETVYDQAQRAVREFFVGRGLTLLLALGAFGATFLALHGTMNRVLRYRDRKSAIRRSLRARIALLAYRLFATLLAILVFMMVLYAAGDLVLFALALIVLIALLLSFRTYLPRYMSEARLFLNAGQVREGERVIYRGIPWRVGAIGFYARLVNPELDNGLLLLPLAELASLISRPTPEDEPWFPTRPGEYVLLGDGTFALVERQTPEVVQLKVMGNTVLYATTDFLAKNPRNLSRGSYISAVVFGIDYGHQAIATTEAPEIFRQGILDALADSPVADHVEDLLVEFREAADSSLDYQIVATINGAAAGFYFKVGRIIQKACVDVCNARGWVIPFNQLTVHQGEGFDALRARGALPGGGDAASVKPGALARWFGARP